MRVRGIEPRTTRLLPGLSPAIYDNLGHKANALPTELYALVYLTCGVPLYNFEHIRRLKQKKYSAHIENMDQLLGMIQRMSMQDKKENSTEMKDGKKRRMKTKSNEASKRRAMIKTDGSTGSQAHVSAAHAPMAIDETMVVRTHKHKKSSKSSSDGAKMHVDPAPTRKITRARRTGTRTNSRRVAPLPFQPLPQGASKLGIELYDEMQRLIIPYRTVAPQLQSFQMAVQGRYHVLMTKGQLSPKQVNILKVHRDTYHNLKDIYENSGVTVETLLQRIQQYLNYVEAERLKVDGEARLRMSQEYSRIFVHFPEVKHIVEDHKNYVIAKAVYEPDTVRIGELEKADELLEMFGNFRM